MRSSTVKLFCDLFNVGANTAGQSTHNQVISQLTKLNTIQQSCISSGVLEASGSKVLSLTTAVRQYSTQGTFSCSNRLSMSVMRRQPGGFGVLMRTAQTIGMTGVRRMGTSLAGVDEAVKAKAVRMSLWVGGIAGVFGSFVGVGGGVLIAPIIANACRSLPQRVISGTSLAAVVAVGSASGYVYWKEGCLDPMSSILVAMTAVLTAPLGARATHMVNCNKLRTFMGYWLYFVAPLIPLKVLIFSYLPQDTQPPIKSTTPSSATPTPGVAAHSTVAGKALDSQQVNQGSSQWSVAGIPLRELRGSDTVLAAVGGIAGFMSGLLGIGGGTIVTPLLALVTGLPQTSVVGTSLAAMILPSIVGLTQHTFLGNVYWKMAAGLIAGSAVGSYLGSHVAVHAPPFALEMAFALGMAYLGHKTLKVAALTKAGPAVAAAAAKVAGAK